MAQTNIQYLGASAPNTYSGKNPGPNLLQAWAEQERQDKTMQLVAETSAKPTCTYCPDDWNAADFPPGSNVVVGLDCARTRAAFRAGEQPKDRPAPPPMVPLIDVTDETRRLAESAMEAVRGELATPDADPRAQWCFMAHELASAELFETGGICVADTDDEPLPAQTKILDQFATDHRDAWPGQAEHGGLFAWSDARQILRQAKWAVLKTERAAAARREAEEAKRKANDDRPAVYRVIDKAVKDMPREIGDLDLNTMCNRIVKRSDFDANAQAYLIEQIAANTHMGKTAARQAVKQSVDSMREESRSRKKATGNIINQDDFKDQLAYARESLKTAHKNDPTLFRFGTGVGRVQHVAEESTTSVNVLNKDGLRAEINTVTDYKQMNEKGDAKGKAAPPDVVSDLYQDHQLPLPYLRGVTTYPQFDGDGVFLAKNGYHETAYLFMQLPDDLVMPVLSMTPSEEEVTEALRLLIEEWLADFPFDGYSRRQILLSCKLVEPTAGEVVPDIPPSLANFLAFLLQMITRAMIGNHPVPATLITKPESGTGASLLVSLVQLLITGKPSTRPPFPKDQDEQRKEVLTALLGGDPFIFLDNVVGNLDSPVLASLLTSANFTGRILGRSEEVSVPNQASTIITGNNPRFTRELQRRLSLVRLNAGMDRPDHRNGWHLDDIEEWTLANRGALLGALATLVMNWQAQCEDDRKPMGVPLASYRAWYNVVGGILAACGLGEAFQANRDQIEMVAGNDDDDPMREFVAKWFEVATKSGTELGLSGVYAKDLAALANTFEIELPVAKQMVDGERVYKTDAFGKYLGMQAERVFSVEGENLRIEPGKKTKSGKPWQLLVSPDEIKDEDE